MKRYVQSEMDGMWNELMSMDGTFSEKRSARSSSLYNVPDTSYNVYFFIPMPIFISILTMRTLPN